MANRQTNRQTHKGRHIICFLQHSAEVIIVTAIMSR